MKEFVDWVLKILGINNSDEKDEFTESEVKEGVDQNNTEVGEEVVVEACVRCTCCTEEKSEVLVFSRKRSNVVLPKEKELLNHKDTVLKDTFKGCINTADSKCKIEILDNIWFDPNENNEVGDGYEVDEKKSFMICLTGCGMIYISDSGQSIANMEDKLENELLDRVINEEAFISMGWPKADDGKLLLFQSCGSDVFDKMKKSMKEFGIVNAVSIKMFLATLQQESDGGKYKLEDGDAEYLKDLSYTTNVRGAGLIQITGESQKIFLEYKYNNLSEDDPMKSIIEAYIKGYTKGGGDNTYLGPASDTNAASFIANNFSIESAAWYWGGQEKFGYSEGPMKGKTETINDFVVRHANDNQYNTFAATQMRVNGTEFKDAALDRFSECENNCEIKAAAESKCGEQHDITKYCFTLVEDPNNNGENVSRHSYGPNGWVKREESYNLTDRFFENLE